MTIVGGDTMTAADFPQSFSKGIALTETTRIMAAHQKCVGAVTKLREQVRVGADSLYQRSDAENANIWSRIVSDAVPDREWAQTVGAAEKIAQSPNVQIPADVESMSPEEADELATQVAEEYLRSNGWPTSRGEAQAIAEQYFVSELQKRGVPTSVIQQALNGQLVESTYRMTVTSAKLTADTYFQEEYGFALSEIPMSREAAERLMESWTEQAIEMGTSYRIDLKMPRSWQDGAQAVALAVTAIVCSELGIDMRIGTVLVESMMDGRIDENECAAIGGVAGSVACGGALQAFGVPYPIGAFVGGMLGSTIGKAVADIFQIGEEERRKLRQAALEEACEVALAAHYEYSATCNQWREAYYREFESSRLALESAWSMMEANPDVGRFELRYFTPATTGTAKDIRWACGVGAGCSYPGMIESALTKKAYPSQSAAMDRAASAILARLGGDFPFQCPGCTAVQETDLQRLQREDLERQRAEVESGSRQPTWQELQEASEALDSTWAQRTAKMGADYALRTHSVPDVAQVHAPYVSVEQWREYELQQIGSSMRVTEYAPGQCERSCFGPSWTCWGTSGLWGGLWNCDREYYYLRTLREVQLAFAKLRAAVAQVKADLLRTATEVASENYARAHAAEIQRSGLRHVLADVTTKINGLNVFSEVGSDGQIVSYKQRRRIAVWRTKVAPVVKYGALAGGVALLGYALLKLRGIRR